MRVYLTTMSYSIKWTLNFKSLSRRNRNSRRKMTLKGIKHRWLQMKLRQCKQSQHERPHDRKKNKKSKQTKQRWHLSKMTSRNDLKQCYRKVDLPLRQHQHLRKQQAGELQQTRLPKRKKIYPNRDLQKCQSSNCKEQRQRSLTLKTTISELC